MNKQTNELGKCEVCQIEQAVYLMYPTFTEDKNTPSTPVPMCVDCAFKAFEAGTHESENDYS